MVIVNAVGVNTKIIFNTIMRQNQFLTGELMYD